VLIPTSDPEPGSVSVGAELVIDASVSGDLKYVTLRIRPTVTSLVELRTVAIPGVVGAAIEFADTNNQTLDTTVTVPDGGTLLLGGLKTFAQAEREMGVPILSKVPIINRAFANRAKVKDDSTLLILVKPTIIVPRDEETRMFPTFP
jgi:type II secretory pathway component GspD/PulD (secretin)